MDDRLSRIEASIHDLDRRLRAIERGGAIAPVLDEADETQPPLIRRESAGEFLSLSGRTLVAIGGAYLLRALTDSGTLQPAVGVTLGFAYAAVWLAAADYDGARGRGRSAAFHALVGCLIAFPLVGEATARFRILGAGASAGALAAATGAALGVAVHRRLQAIAWLAVLLALPAAIGLITATGSALPYSLFLVVAGVVTLWVGYAWDWTWLRWPVAFAADVTVLALAARASGAGRAESPQAVVAVQLLLLSGYLGSIALRTIVRARDVIVFEVVQTAAALAVGFGGAVYIARLTGSGADLLALINLVFGIGCYGVAFVFVRDRPRNFYFYSSLALLLIISSGRLLLDPPAVALAFSALAVGCRWAAAGVGAATLTAHAAIYLTAAAVASHLLTAGLHALAGPAGVEWTPFSRAAVATMVALFVCWGWTRGSCNPSLQPYQRTPRVLMAILVAWSAAGWTVSAATTWLAGTPGAGADAGVVATIRTAAIASTALALGWIGRDARFREALWLLYPVLALAGVKLLCEDFPRSRPSTLFIALAVYGGVLIAAPRLSRRRP